MNISLPAELERMVNEKVQLGIYSSSSEVVREALRLLFEKEILHKQRLAQLNADIKIGLEAAEQGKIIDGPAAMNNIINRYD